MFRGFSLDSCSCSSTKPTNSGSGSDNVLLSVTVCSAFPIHSRHTGCNVSECYSSAKLVQNTTSSTDECCSYMYDHLGWSLSSSTGPIKLCPCYYGFCPGLLCEISSSEAFCCMHYCSMYMYSCIIQYLLIYKMGE